MFRLNFECIPIRLFLLAILIHRGEFDTTHQSTLITSAPINSKNTTETLILTAEQRHNRLMKIRMQKLENSTNLRYKPSNKIPKFGTKLTKPITNHVTKGLRVNAPPQTKKLRQPENSSEYLKSIVKKTRPDTKFKKVHIHSSGSEQHLPPSRLYLLLDHEIRQVKSSPEMKRTTMTPTIFRLKIPTNIKNPEGNHYGAHSRVIVDVDDELEASGFNALEELDNRVVPFQPRNHKWHLRTGDNVGKSKFRLNSRKALHRGENAV